MEKQTEYIERKDALDVLDGGSYESITYEFAINAIPAADVAPVVRAEWEEDADDITCPVCKNHWNKCDNDTETFDHCPRCGATMLGVKSNG